ncbi:hypothetical protein MKX03_036420 [Papaver bracteatum]|nr:hypothetical protein MKX03_036420 [Papaver bracteatum]
MDSNLVIKVKYGDVLRRFTVTVNANGILDMGMAGLTAKICSLFKFNSVDDITLTYIDEDKDVVTLVDDEDLRDVIGQRLNPLRINVLLKTSSGEMFDATSSGWSTPSSQQQQQGNQLNRINSGLNEALKSLPDPLGDVLSKLSSDLASKAVSSAPALSELVERFAKLGMIVTTSQSQGHGTDLSADNKVNENAKKSSSASEAPLDPTKTTKAKGISSSTSPTSDLSFDYLFEPQNASSGNSFAAGSSGSSGPMVIPVPNPIPSAPVNPNLKRVSSCGEKREMRGSGSGQPSAPNHGSPVSEMIGGNSSEAAPVAGYWGVRPFRRSHSHFYRCPRPLDGSSCISTTTVVAPPPLRAVSDARTAEGNDINNNVEESLLKELAGMGFKEIDLNKEILRLNEYNLEQSLDDLCGVSEWDPILEELRQMGFPDRETNKMLLIKNGGSIKRVVMDLVAGEKTE